MITNCNCSERIDCNCSVSFDIYGNNLYSVLSVGNLVGNGCTLDDYVIDWYCDGVHAMMSSKIIKSGIDAYHPFTGSAAIPVKAGTWVPVLRYVVIGGEKVFPTPRNCQKWCSDLQGNLPTITVLPIGCNVVSGSPDAGYTFRISYNTTQDYSFASRTILWDLPADGSAKYLALKFTTYYVPDRVQVFYNDEITPLSDIVVGFDRSGTIGNTVPPFLDQQGTKLVVNITDRVYHQGDYLTIKVTPNPNPNTNWVLDMKCLGANAFECDLFPLTLRDIDFQNIQMTFVPASCKYVLTFPVGIISSNYLNSNLYKYNSINTFGNTADATMVPATGIVSLTMWDKISGDYQALHTHYDSDANGTVSYSKDGSVFTFSFDNVLDYNAYKAWYNGNRSNWKFSSFTPDVTDVNHYKIFQISWKETHTRCGDAFTYKSIYFHWNSVVTFNDGAMTMAIDFCDITNQYPHPDPVPRCEATWSVINTWVTVCQNSKSAADWSGWTKCIEQRPVNGIWIYKVETNELSKEFWLAYAFWLKYLENVCDMPGWAEFESLSWRYQFQLINLKVDITNAGDRTNNFMISSQLNRETGENTGAWTKIFEKQNGVQIYP